MHSILRVFLLGGVTLLAGCGDSALRAAQQQVMAQMQEQLPAPYREGLVIDSMHRHGDDLVQVIRFPDATVAMAKAKPDVFASLRRDEAEFIVQLCQDTTLQPIYANGGGVRRRFIDANGAVFFEVTLVSSQCVSH